MFCVKISNVEVLSWNVFAEHLSFFSCGKRQINQTATQQRLQSRKRRRAITKKKKYLLHEKGNKRTKKCPLYIFLGHQPSLVSPREELMEHNESHNIYYNLTWTHR